MSRPELFRFVPPLRSVVTWSVAGLLVTISPRTASACHACVDQGVEYRMPYALPVSAVMLVWLIVGYLQRRRLRRQYFYDRSRTAEAQGISLDYFAWATGMALLVGSFTLTLHLCLWIVTTAWLIFLGVQVVRGRLRNGIGERRRPLLRRHVVALGASLLLCPAAYAYARRPECVVSYLGNPHNTWILEHVVDKGASAVPALDELIDAGIHGVTAVPTYKVTQACYCLSQIRGAEAERVLQKTVTQVLTSEPGDGRWQLIACCSYADVAGERSIPDLMRLRDTATDVTQRVLRVAALCALARTGDSEALLYVVDHLEDLLEAAEGYTDQQAVAAVCAKLAQRLVLGRDRDRVMHVPLYGSGTNPFGFPASAVQVLEVATFPAAEPDIKPFSNDIKYLRHRWETDCDQLRTEWAARLGPRAAEVKAAKVRQ